MRRLNSMATEPLQRSSDKRPIQAGASGWSAAITVLARLLAASAVVLAALFGLLTLAEKEAQGTRVPRAAPARTAQLVVTSQPAAQSPQAAEAVPSATDDGSYEIQGHVVDLDGKPVGGARVFTSDGETATRPDGSFRILSGRLSRWVTVEHDKFLSRTRAAAPGTPLLVRLTPDDGRTISLHFAGDTMFGRRFYDANEDGRPDDGLLRPGDGASEHLALLSGVLPLLENADVTVLNLESSLSAAPYLDPTLPRPAYLHPTKQYVFLSHTSAAVALRQAGVDVVGLANNHVYDALEKGLGETESALEQAGFVRGAGYFGAGASEALAWQPAVVWVRGQSVAFLGCTSITRPIQEGIPDENAITYVASDAGRKGGAARCTDTAIRAAVSDAQTRYDAVAFMVHGGLEYERVPTEFVSRMTTAAREAGARLVINHQTHVTGELDWNGASLAAWSLGNFVFDQTFWPTFESYLLAVDLRQGQVVRAYVEPVTIEGSLPKGVTGSLADSIARSAAGSLPGPWVLENGALEVDVAGRAEQVEETLSARGDPVAGSLYQVKDGWGVSRFSGTGSLRVGRDLLWFGSFEDEDVDEQYLENVMWNLGPPYKSSGPAYAYEGEAGVRLERGARDREDAVLSPMHRILTKPGSELSVAGTVRASEGAEVSLQLSWYTDTSGPSDSQTVWPIPVESSKWQTFHLQAVAPGNAVAVGLFLRLAPPTRGLATADLDNLRLIEWSPGGSGLGLQYEYLLVTGEVEITLTRSHLPGGETRAGKAALVALDE